MLRLLRVTGELVVQPAAFVCNQLAKGIDLHAELLPGILNLLVQLVQVRPALSVACIALSAALVALVEPIAGGSGIPEVKTYLQARDVAEMWARCGLDVAGMWLVTYNL